MDHVITVRDLVWCGVIGFAAAAIAAAMVWYVNATSGDL